MRRCPDSGSIQVQYVLSCQKASAIPPFLPLGVGASQPQPSASYSSPPPLLPSTKNLWSSQASFPWGLRMPSVSFLELNGKQDRPLSELAGDWDSAPIPPHSHALTPSQHSNLEHAQPFPVPSLPCPQRSSRRVRVLRAGGLPWGDRGLGHWPRSPIPTQPGPPRHRFFPDDEPAT